MRGLHTSLLALLCGALASPLIAAWQSLPAGHPFVSTVVTDTSSQRILFSGYSCGMWQTTVGGQSWTPVSSRFTVSRGQSAARWTVADALASTIIAAFNYPAPDAANHFTTDGGATWQTFADNRVASGGNFHIFTRAPQVWLHSSDLGIVRSIDAGLTWNSTTGMPAAELYFAADPLQDSTLFACDREAYSVPTRVRIFRSGNRGQTWQQTGDAAAGLNVRSAYVYGLTALTDGSLIVRFDGHYQNGQWERLILRSTDGGASWMHTFGNSGVRYSGALLEDRSAPGTLLLTGDVAGGAVRSTDYGQTWSGGLPGLPAGQDYAEALVQNPHGGTILLQGTRGVFRSTDHGASWQSVTPPPAGANGMLYVLPGAVAQWLSGESPASHWQLDAPFAEWSAVNVPQRVGDTTYWSSRLLYKSGDTLITYARRSIYRDSLGGISSDHMLTSHDNGNQWTTGSDLGLGADEYYMNSYRNSSGTRIAALTWNHDRLYTSTNLGLNWMPYAPLEAHDSFVSSIVQDSLYVYVLANLYTYAPNYGYRVYRVAAGSGEPWWHLPAVYSARRTALLLPVDGRTYLFTDSVRYWAGMAWENLGAIPTACRRGFTGVVHVPGDPPRFVAADSARVFISADDGRTWQMREFDLPFAAQSWGITALTYDGERERLWAMTGVGACWLDAHELAIPGAPLRFKPADYTVLAAYPNPFNERTRIRFDLLAPQRVMLALYDLHGRRVHTLADEVCAAGRHERHVDAQGLASGTYFLRLQSAAAVRTQKILLIR